MNRILLLLFVILVSCKSSSEDKMDTQTLNLEKLEIALDSLFNSKIGKNEPGVAVLVAYNQKKIFAKGFGVRNLETSEPITTATNLEIASVTKPFTALAILSLVDQGKLKLSDTVFNILPYETFKDVTVHQLINHTSGIDDAEIFLLSNWNSTKIATNQDILKWYSKANRKIAKPGAETKYNDGAYEVIPLIVEKVSGMAYDDFIKTFVFEKAGMKTTIAYDFSQPVDIAERAHYYHKDSIGSWHKMDGHLLTGIHGAGGIYTNLDDYFQYDLALRNHTIFSEEIHDIIFKPSNSESIHGIDYPFAMGWEVTENAAQHYGGWFGVNSFTKHYLNKPLTLAFFSNKDSFFEDGLIEKTDSLVNTYIKNQTILN